MLWPLATKVSNIATFGVLVSIDFTSGTKVVLVMVLYDQTSLAPGKYLPVKESLPTHRVVSLDFCDQIKVTKRLFVALG